MTESRHGEFPPLKRHPTLQPLSREHMSGLVQARNLLHAAGRAAQSESEPAAPSTLPDRKRTVADFVRAWQAELAEHFKDEERLLLPLITSPAMRDRLISEHQAMRVFANRCEQEPARCAADVEFLANLGQLLHDHIRWEERELFEAVQRSHPDELAALHAEAAAIETRRPGAAARSTSRTKLSR